MITKRSLLMAIDDLQKRVTSLEISGQVTEDPDSYLGNVYAVSRTKYIEPRQLFSLIKELALKCGYVIEWKFGTTGQYEVINDKTTKAK